MHLEQRADARAQAFPPSIGSTDHRSPVQPFNDSRSSPSPGGGEGRGEGVPSLPLSPQQARVLALLERGALIKHIADELHISHNTVKKHLQKLYRKVGADNARHAIHLCRFRSNGAPLGHSRARL